MASLTKISPCLWYDDRAEEAAEFYTSIFKNSKLGEVTRYSEAGQELHGKQPGEVMSVHFELDGCPFLALNGGPMFQFTEAISLQVFCEDQEELDYFWDRLSAGGDPNAQNCGWLKDKFGLSWQILPRALAAMVASPDAAQSQRVIAALLQMSKLDIAELEKAYAG